MRGVIARALADLLNVYRTEHGLEFTALAMTNVYGTRQRPSHGVVAALLDAIGHGQAGRGARRRSPDPGLPLRR